MKIGIDCHNVEGQRTGVGRYLRNLLREWAFDEEAEFFLYFRDEVPSDVYELSQHTTGWNTRSLNGKSNAIFKHWLLPKAAGRDGVGILFCPDYVLPLRLSHRLKTAVTIHDIIYEAHPEQYSWPSWKDKILLQRASKRSARNADVIFAPSEFTKREILKYYKVNPEKVVVTPLAPDPIFQKANRAGSDPARLDQIKQRHDITSSTYIFFVGSIFNRRFLPQKILGFAEFAKGNPDYQFVIIGKNHTRPFQDVGALIARMNKELGREAIVWKEQTSDEDLVYLYNGAFVTLWLSSYEGFGLPVLESMACGTPVITSPMGSLPEIAGDAAVYVAHPENSSEITSALFRLVREDAYRQDLIPKGLARVQNFSWQKCARDTLGNIRSV